MGYRVAVLDPDPDCPAAASPTWSSSALRRRRRGAAARRRSAMSSPTSSSTSRPRSSRRSRRWSRPARARALLVTQDRLAERRFVEAAGSPSRRGARSGRSADARAAADDARACRCGSSCHRRLRRPRPDPDHGRGRARRRLGARSARRRAPSCWPSASSRSRSSCRSSSPAADGQVAAFPVARNLHDAGILVESFAPAPASARVTERAAAIGDRARDGDGPGGTLTVELFLMPDGRSSSTSSRRASTTAATGRSKAPRPPSSSSTSGRSAGWGSGSTDALGPTAMVNLLGTGPRRDRPGSWASPTALADPAVHLHLYDKREVFERRKMGHLTALGADRRTGARDGRPGAVPSSHWARRDRADGGRPMSEGRRTIAPSSASSAAAARTSRRSRRPSPSSTSSACRPS